MSRSQVLKALQSHKKYKHKTQKEICSQFNTLELLRNELHRIENKKINLGGNRYTKTELITMVQFYRIHHLPPLNNDMIREIMLNASSDTIQNMRLMNKATYKMCDKSFWVDKFQHDCLPWIDSPCFLEYDKMLWSCQTAIKLLNNIQCFTPFTTNMSCHDFLWLPKPMVDYVTNDPDHEIGLYFNVESLELITQDDDYDSEKSETVNETNLIVKVTEQEWIRYLTLLLYHYYNHDGFMLISWKPHAKDKYLYMEDLFNTTSHLKSYFPNW